MPDLKSLDNLYLVLGFLVPGLIVLFVRSRFVTGRSAPQSQAFLHYFTVSVIYYIIVPPIVDFVLTILGFTHWKFLTWLILFFILPVVIGLLLGADVQKGISRRLLQKCRLNPVHSITAAWDWKFSNITEQWVLVTLKDGTRFGGFCGPDSFISSDPAERDIYIEEIYDIDADNTWTSPGEKGVLIAAGEVRTIEFWPFTPQENGNEQK